MKHHPFTKLWPMLEGADLVKLQNDIKAHGQRMAILTYKGEILDGRNRERACKAAGIEPRYDEAQATTDEEALELVVSLNEHRRHLTLAQRAFAAEKLATLQNGSNRFKSKVGSSAELPISETRTLNASADRMKVSHGSAKRARIIRNHGTEADVEEVINGKTTLNAKADELRAGARSTRKPPPPAPRIVFSSAPPLRALTMQQVEPGFSGTPTEFVDRYGHHQSSTAAERSRTVLIAWTGAMRLVMNATKKVHPWPSDLPHWLEHLDKASQHEVAKLAEAVEYLRSKLAFAEALLARAIAVTDTENHKAQG